MLQGWRWVTLGEQSLRTNWFKIDGTCSGHLRSSPLLTLPLAARLLRPCCPSRCLLGRCLLVCLLLDRLDKIQHTKAASWQPKL